MWFAALGSYQHNPWLIHLMYLLLIGQPEVLQLLDLPPFDKPPLYVRAKLYTYHYTDPGCYPSRYVCLSLFVLELDDVVVMIFNVDSSNSYGFAVAGVMSVRCISGIT